MIIDIATMIESTFGYGVSLWATALPMTYVVVRQAYKRQVDLTLIALAFILFPMLTPLFTALNGYEVFTMMNYDIQTPILNLSAALLIAIMFFGFLLGSGAKFQSEPRKAFQFTERTLFVIVALNLFLMVSFLETGTILYSGYGELKVGDTAPYSSLVNQFFNLSIALLCASVKTDRRKMLISIVIVIFILLCLVVSRRTLAMGLAIVLLSLSSGNKLGPREIIAGLTLLFLLWFIGIAREVGVVNYFSGASSIIIERNFYSLPGGASNVFLSIVGVIHMLDTVDLTGAENMPILLWPFGIYEGAIYEDQGYQYNGGMHIATILYWNFGVIGVFFGGALFGSITKFCSVQLFNFRNGGLPLSFSVLFSVLLPNTLWYGPVGLIKAGLTLVIGYAFLKAMVSSYSTRVSGLR